MIAPLNVGMLPGIGHATTRLLNERGFPTAQDVCRAVEARLGFLPSGEISDNQEEADSPGTQLAGALGLGVGKQAIK